MNEFVYVLVLVLGVGAAPLTVTERGTLGPFATEDACAEFGSTFLAERHRDHFAGRHGKRRDEESFVIKHASCEEKAND